MALLMLSFVLGVRHALEIDHLAAVATIASERKGAWSASIVGALWGLGHTAALVVACGAVIAFRWRIPARVESLLELGVAAMLVGLGVRLLWSLRSGSTLHVHGHTHGGRVHVHPHLHPPTGPHASPAHAHGVSHDVPHAHGGPVRWRRPLLVGVAHGLAGSAALMVAVLATIPSPALALAYVAIFGAGSIAGMVVTSALVGMPLSLAAARWARLAAATRLAAGLASVAVGLALAWRAGVARGLWA